tara:strand:+ start:308 stop:610 length:303 start_codon:yes stop_codon:yes gene_type:complete
MKWKEILKNTAGRKNPDAYGEYGSATGGRGFSSNQKEKKPKTGYNSNNWFKEPKGGYKKDPNYKSGMGSNAEKPETTDKNWLQTNIDKIREKKKLEDKKK